MSRAAWRATGTWGDDVRAALVPWVASRALVLGALALARRIVSDLAVVPRPLQTGQGLLAWDAAFYADIAAGGYDAVPRAGLRFFPLVPLLGRAAALVPAVDAELGLLVVVHASAFAFAALLHHLVVRETGDGALARRAVWLGALVPPAVVLVMGYAEATFMALSVAAFLALRGRRWPAAAALGFAAGLTRPAAFLLAVPAAVEAARGWRHAGRRVRAARVAAVAAPGAGMLAYLLWVRARTGDLFLALRLHEDRTLRGPTVDPFTNLWDAARDLFSGERVGSGLHLVSVVVLALLVAMCARRWPPAYAAYAAASLLLGVTADNLDSLERYSLATFPFLLAAAALIERPNVERVVLAGAAGGLVAFSLLVFTGVAVP